MFEYFIAKRYMHSKNRLNFISIISILSTVGVAIGVAALVIVLSVFNGFGNLVTSMLVNFDPHLRITNISENFTDFNKVKNILSENNEINSFSSFAEGKVVLIKNKSTEILSLKGIPSENAQSMSRVKSRITYGEMDLTNDEGIDKIILSLPIAIRLSCVIGDTVFATSAVQIKKTITRMTVPKSKPLVVSGIYEISNKEYALSYTFASIKTAQQIFDMGKRISGFEIILHNIDDAESVKNKLTTQIDSESAKIYSWYDLHKDLYTVMLIERWAAYILLSLIIAVAAFNILSSLTMSVIEKKKDIAVLRSMGATKSSIKKIFMFEGILIGFIGTIAGIGLGLLVCYLHINFNLYPLDASKFVIDTIPIKINLSDIIAVSLMSFFLTFLASKYPANKALKVNLLEAIKWE
ncbi:MAG: ABC transporter permease [Ignavibacteriae bacterium]|nr:ABC transporter permease [Ignavibacteriota bacterium]